MICDPVVDEVRSVRQEHAKQFNYDLQAIAEDLRKLEQEHPERLVTLPAKQPHKKRTAS
jgi:hypothetical protein